jgi:hypothetical protein
MPRRSAAVLLVLAVFLILSRALLWTSHAPNFDFANFALGVARFAPQDHQPHPPGYPAVVLLAKAFHLLGASPVRALHLVALLGSLLAVLGAYLFTRREWGETAGLAAAVLLTVQPVFWYSALTSPTRVFLAAGVAWLFYLLPNARLFPIAVGVSAGFRPELPFFLALPVWLTARGRFARTAALSFLFSLPWLVWLAFSFGSPSRLLYVYYNYFLHHTGTTSALLGAPAAAWQALLRDSLLWNGPLALLAFRRRPPAGFVAYLAPALIIQLFFHLAPDAPDHTLGTITAFCLLAVRLRTFFVLPASALFLSLSLAPPRLLLPDLDILSVRSFRASQRPIARTISRLRSSLQPNDAIVVLPDAPFPHRLLGPEFPGIPIYLLDRTSPALLHRYRQVPLSTATPDLSRYRRIHTLP